MAYQVSAGIEVKEHNVSTYIAGVSSSVAAIAGAFSWGAIEKPMLVSNEPAMAYLYGRPTDNNYETFMIAGNFLSYSTALYVSRAADANTRNAVGALTGSPQSLLIKNEVEYQAKEPTIPNGINYVARYGGAYGNSIRVSTCDSAAAFDSVIGTGFDPAVQVKFEFVPNDTNMTVTLSDNVNNDTSLTIPAATALIASLTVGDRIVADAGELGTQSLRIVSIGTHSSTANETSFEVTFDSYVRLPETVSAATVRRTWEFYDLVQRPPATSPWVAARGGSGDELHMVVVDVLGRFSSSPNQVLEVHQSLSRARDAKHEDGTSLFFKTRLNDDNGSMYIYAVNLPSAAPIADSELIRPVVTRPSNIRLTGGVDTVNESALPLSAFSRATQPFVDKDNYDISIFIAGKSTGGAQGEAPYNHLIDNIAEVRKDVIVTASPAITHVVNNPFRERDSLMRMRTYMRKSSYGFMSSSYKQQLDKYNDKIRWVAGCGDDAGLMARTDYEFDPWFSPAGHNRGVYKNLITISYSPDKADRDELYKNDINPVINIRGSGTILYGDKTMLGAPSAFDRVGVRRLFIVMEKAIEKAARDFLFEFNDEYTRARFRNMVDPFLRDIKGRRGINEYRVICDERNNTPAVIDRNEFVGSVLVKPNKSINYITLNFYAVGQTVDFEYVITTG